MEGDAGVNGYGMRGAGASAGAIEAQCYGRMRIR